MSYNSYSDELYLSRKEILEVVKKLRQKHNISSPYRMYCDERHPDHISAINGITLKYYLMEASKENMKKFLKHLDKVLDVFGLEPVFIKEPDALVKPGNLFSLQIFNKESN